MPKWLSKYDIGNMVNMKEIMQNRTIYNPGSGTDATPINLFNKAYYAHLYVYADDRLDLEQTKKEFLGRKFPGYECIHIQDITINDLVQNGEWEPHVNLSHEQIIKMSENVQSPIGFLAVLHRDNNYHYKHGLKRFAVIFLRADGNATYEALFASKRYPLDVLVLQEKGSTLHYNRFGAGGLMEQIAQKTNVFPPYILWNHYANVWDHYIPIHEIAETPETEYPN